MKVMNGKVINVKLIDAKLLKNKVTNNRIQRGINYSLKASHTLEAALVVPVVLFTIISIMYFVFYIHDRVVLEMCAYNSAIESVYNNQDIHSIAKDNIEKLNTLVIVPTSTWTEESYKNEVKYIGRYVAPFTFVELFMKNEQISESSYAYQKMKCRNMYIIKVAKDLIVSDEH